MAFRMGVLGSGICHQALTWDTASLSLKSVVSVFGTMVGPTVLKLRKGAIAHFLQSVVKVSLVQQQA